MFKPRRGSGQIKPPYSPSNVFITVAVAVTVDCFVFVLFLLLLREEQKKLLPRFRQLVFVIHVRPTRSVVTTGLLDHTIVSVHQQSVGAQLGDPCINWKVHIILAERVRKGHSYLPQANRDEDGEEEDNGCEEGDER